MTNMKPHIVVSSHDLERLEALADSLPSSAAATSEALLNELARAEVVAPGQVPPSVVTMNSKVRFAIEATGEEFCLTLSYPQDANDDPDRISVLSPVGTALLGMSAGGRIEWPAPHGGNLQVTILDVLCQPGRAEEPCR